MSNNAIQEKIRKLLALANDSTDGGEAERESAMNMVQKLLLKYRIEMNDIVLDENDSPDVTSETFHFHNAPWIRNIINGISKMNFCQYYWQKDYVRGAAYGYHTIVGLPHEIEATIELVKALYHSCHKETTRLAKIHSHDKSFKRSFLNAASNRIYRRAVDLVTSSIEDQTVQGTALVIQTAYEQAEKRNAEYLEEAGTKLKEKATRMKSKSHSGVVLGKSYGSAVSLSNTVKIA